MYDALNTCKTKTFFLTSLRSIFIYYRTAKNVGKSTAPNFPAVKRHARNERTIIISKAGLILLENLPDFCQLEK